MTVFYADLSQHDWDRRGGQLDWAAVRTATSPVVCIRATYGDPSGWSRPTYHFRDMAIAARAAGFTMVGGYHNLVTGDAASMRRQVDWLRRELDAVGGSWAMADVERYPELMTAGMFPRWADVLRFQDAWYAADSRVMGWYLPQWVWSRSDMGSPDLSRLQGPLVASRYPTTTDGTPATVYAAAKGDAGPGWAAYGGKAPAIWQFSSTVNVAGASGNTDVNAFRGTLAELTALLTGDDMGDYETSAIHYTDNRVRALVEGLDKVPGTALAPEGAGGSVWMVGQLKSLAKDVADLKARPPVAAATVDPAALKEALLDPQVLAAVAKAVVDEQAARLES